MKTRLWLLICIVLFLIASPVFADGLTRVYGSVQRIGVNQVTIDNSENMKEAVVVFREINWPIPFAVHLSPKQVGVLNLPSESYQVWYSLGYGWNTTDNRFSREPEYYMISGIYIPGSKEAEYYYVQKYERLLII